MKKFNLILYLSILFSFILISCTKSIDCTIQNCKGDFYKGHDKYAPNCDEINAIIFQREFKNGTGWVEKSIESNIVNVMYSKYKPYSGKVKQCYDNGRIKSIATFKNGFHNGVTLFYHENGHLSDKVKFFNDLLVSRFVYYRNGMIKEKEIYLIDMKYNKRYIYNKNGKLIKVTLHDHDDEYFGREIDCWGECDLKQMIIRTFFTQNES